MSDTQHKPHMVQCRICKTMFDAQPDTEGVEWVRPVRNWYYHKKCYEEWSAGKENKESNGNDEVWIDYLFEFFGRDLKVQYNYFVCMGQIKKYQKQNMTAKGIFYAAKYIYDIKGTKFDDEEKNPNLGIGLIPYVYAESCEYWAKQMHRNERILEEIEAQMAALAESRKKEKFHKKKKQKVNTKTINWEEIENS